MHARFVSSEQPSARWQLLWLYDALDYFWTWAPHTVHDQYRAVREGERYMLFYRKTHPTNST